MIICWTKCEVYGKVNIVSDSSHDYVPNSYHIHLIIARAYRGACNSHMPCTDGEMMVVTKKIARASVPHAFSCHTRYALDDVYMYVHLEGPRRTGKSSCLVCMLPALAACYCPFSLIPPPSGKDLYF